MEIPRLQGMQRVRALHLAEFLRPACLCACLSQKTPDLRQENLKHLAESRLRRLEIAAQLFLFCLSQPAPFQVPAMLPAKLKRLLLLPPRRFRRLSAAELFSNPGLCFFPSV